MSCFARAINIIKKYEGYSERAYPDPLTGGEPYTLGYGSQYYPDGTIVKKGQCCTKQKAMEYLLHDIEVIEGDLKRLNLGLDGAMTEALVSFVHSVGWEPFLYSQLIDNIECENWPGLPQYSPPGSLGKISVSLVGLLTGVGRKRNCSWRK
jgi:lysozyme